MAGLKSVKFHYFVSFGEDQSRKRMFRLVERWDEDMNANGN
jgi:hypothetical protein